MYKVKKKIISKRSRPKILDPKNDESKKIWGPKSVGPKRIWGPKSFGLGPKNVTQKIV